MNLTTKKTTTLTGVFIALLAAVSLLLLGGPPVSGSPQQTQTQPVVLGLYADFTPVAAVGLRFDATGVVEIPAAFATHGKNTFTVTFPVTLPTGEPEVFLSALLVSEQGKSAYSNVQRLGSIESHRRTFNLPPCPARAARPELASHIGQLTSIVDIRSQRRENREIHLQEQLSGALLEKLQRYEEVFGWQSPTPLSPDLHPIDLTYRLQRILFTWQSLQQARQQP